ncbi:hypothetical protein N8902_01740, partial [Flavobacteriaceae bacterium]|nr:hypothetical protein [Flavobacteriaceae bacterium]
VLTMRLVDRVLRPLFPKDYHAETQVMIQLMSHDENVMFLESFFIIWLNNCCVLLQPMKN